MKKWPYYLVILVAAISVVFMAGCTQSEGQTDDQTQEETGATAPATEEQEGAESDQTNAAQFMVQVITDNEEVVAEEMVEANGDSLLDTMKQNFEIEEKDGFIQVIEGNAQSAKDNKYWVFEVNGEQVNVGAQDFTPEGGEEIVWKLTQF